MRSIYKGDIVSVRAVEDAIRATRKYTKGAFSRPAQHPIQGEELPSRTLTEYYEVYPDMDIGNVWQMKATDLWAWVWGDTQHIDVRFQYHYQSNEGKLVIHGGPSVVAALCSGVPGFGDVLGSLVAEVHNVPVPNAGDPIGDNVGV